MPETELKAKSGWITFYSIVMILFGFLMLFIPLAASLAATLVIGITLAVAGLVRIVHAFKTKAIGRFLIDLAIGILYCVAGAIIIVKPVEGMITITAVVGIFFMIEGILAVLAAGFWNPENSKWLLIDGILAAIVGFIIWRHLPGDATWVLGLLLAVRFISSGVTILTVKSIVSKPVEKIQ